jgi:hypothetical protein
MRLFDIMAQKPQAGKRAILLRDGPAAGTGGKRENERNEEMRERIESGAIPIA